MTRLPNSQLPTQTVEEYASTTHYIPVTSRMASKPSIHSSSPITSAPTLPLGQGRRRGSIASLSSRLPLDKERMSQALDQIHIAASQSEMLTTFNDFTPAPSSSSGREGKGLAGELQGGLSGLYSRFRASVGGVTNLVGGLTPDEYKEKSEDKSSSRVESSVQLGGEKHSVGKVQASAVSPPTVEHTPTAPVHPSTLLSNNLLSDQTQLTKASRSSTSAAVVSPKLSGHHSQAGGSKPTLAPLTKATTSSAANPKLAEVHVVALKDADLLGKPASDQSSETHQQSSSLSEISVAPGEKLTPSISTTRGRSHVKSDSEDQRTLVDTVASPQSANHNRSSTQTSVYEPFAGNNNRSSAINQNGILLNTDVPTRGSEGILKEKKVVKPAQPDRMSASRDSPLDQPKPQNGSLSLDTIGPDPIQVEANRQASFVNDRMSDISTDAVKRGPTEASLLDARLENSQGTDRTAPVVSVNQSHVPGFTISHASSSDGELSKPPVTSKVPKRKDRRTITGKAAPNSSLRPSEQPMSSNGPPSASANTVSSQIRSKVLSKDYWMKDENAQDCFYCGDAFSTFRRKHHCRK